MILADTSVWIPYIRRQWHIPAVDELRTLLRRQEVMMTGLVLAEVLQGMRPADGQEVGRLLQALPFLDATKSTWVAAGILSSDLNRQGLPTPLADLVIGTIARENDCTVLALDSHFERVPGLTLHEPDETGEAAHDR